MPNDKSLFQQKLEELSLEETGQTMEQNRIANVQSEFVTKNISIYQDFLSGKLETALNTEIQKLTRENFNVENKISQLTLEVESCNTKLMNQKVLFYFFNISFLVVILVLLYGSLVLIKNRHNGARL